LLHENVLDDVAAAGAEIMVCGRMVAARAPWWGALLYHGVCWSSEACTGFWISILV
jgi:hypothetical protein